MGIYDVIVVGGGHAGCEAALAAARMGCKTLLLTINIDTIAHMSCNPAVGGLAKGHLVKEIDALGGYMGKITDLTAIQYRRLNTSKGPAVRSTRAQVDRLAYRLEMKRVVENQVNLDVIQRVVDEIIVEKGIAIGVKTNIGDEFIGKTVIIAPGTFLNGLIHIGLTNFPAGRLGELPSIKLAENLKHLGFHMGRFKTGTCPRLDGRTIDFSRLKIQPGDTDVPPFSFSNKKVVQQQLPCYITYTNPRTHEIIRSGLDRSPLYTGVIKGTGVRYCPSIEDKVVRFAEKEYHQIFLEPEGRNTHEYYPNGISTSLPIDIQMKMLHSIEGLEDVKMIRPGYAIEHDYVDPTQLEPTLETKLIKNLFLAGQINGTTGYEEAASQGLIAGINAALKVKNEPPFILDRSEAYIGVLIDDLITKGTDEPYRMFTSRAEYRLILREDNADLRLTEKAYRLGLIDERMYQEVKEKKVKIENELERLTSTKLYPNPQTNEKLQELNISPIKEPTTLEELLRRPGVTYQHILSLFPPNETLPRSVIEQVEINVKYKGYINHQEKEIEKFKKIESIKIPNDIDYSKIPGLSTEIKQKLTKIRPHSLAQASRIPGVTPAAVSILMVYLKKFQSKYTTSL